MVILIRCQVVRGTVFSPKNPYNVSDNNVALFFILVIQFYKKYG